MYSWIYQEDKFISKVSVKKNLDNPKKDIILIELLHSKKQRFH